MDFNNSTEVIEFTIKKMQERFKGNKTPITMEMAANIWAELFAIQNLLMDVAKISALNISPTERSQTYLDFTRSLQVSFNHIAKSIEALDGAK